MKKIIFILSVIVIPAMLMAWFFLARPARAITVPHYLSFEGQLSDASGNLLTSHYNLTFRIYEALTGGNAIYTETQNGISTSNGNFSVNIGVSTTLDLVFDRQYWISLEVNSDGEMTPRTQINSVGYSFVAESAFGAFATSSAPDTAQKGSLYFNTTTNQLFVYNGTEWKRTGDVFAWSASTHFGENVNATTSPIWIRENLYVSSTARLDYVSSTAMDLSRLVVSTSVLPSANNAVDFGAYGTAFKNLYASSTLFIGSATTTQIAPWANNTSDLGQFASAWKGVYVSSTSYLNYVSSTAMDLSRLVVSTSVLPSGNNGVDLGAFGTAYKNLYASSTAFATFVSSTAISAPTICIGTDCQTSFPQSAFEWTPTTNFAALANSTSTAIWFKKGLMSSTTAYLDYVSSTVLSVGNEYIKSDADTELQIYAGGTKRATFDTTILFHSDAKMESSLTMGDATGIIFGNGGAGGDSVMIHDTGATPDTLSLAVGDEANGMVLVAAANWWNAYNHPQQANPTLFIHSNNGHAVATDQYLGLTHNQTNAVLWAGTGGIVVSSTSLLPYLNGSSNNATNIGAYGSAWKNIYASSTSHLNYVSSTILQVADGSAAAPSINNGSNSGIYFSSDRPTISNDGVTKFAVATNAILFYDNLRPDENNIRDLGILNAAWKNIYASSTSFLNYVSSTQIGLADGSVSSPSISFTSDASADTGIFYSNSNDSITLGRAGASMMDVGRDGSIYFYESLRASGDNTPMMRDISSTDIVPSIHPKVVDATTGIGGDNGVAMISSSTLIARFPSTGMMPGANNTLDLGRFGTAWNNIYASSTSYLDYVSSTVITAKSLPNSTQSNTLCYNTSSGELTYVSGDSCASSLREHKENINEYAVDMDKLMQLEPVTFTWIDTGKEDFGLIADDVAPLFPELGTYSDEGELIGISYSKIGVVLLKAVQKIWDIITSFGGRLDSLEAENADLKARLESLENSNTDTQNSDTDTQINADDADNADNLDEPTEEPVVEEESEPEPEPESEEPVEEPVEEPST